MLSIYRAMTPRLWILLALAVAVLGTGCGGAVSSAVPGGAPREDPGVFMRNLLLAMADDDYAKAWLSLYPSHQRVATRDEYVECELLSPIPGRVDSIEIVRVLDAHKLIPGEAEAVATKAVTMRVTLAMEDVEEPVTVVHTGHAIAVADRWRFILPPNRFDLYRTDSCAAPAIPGLSA